MPGCSKTLQCLRKAFGARVLLVCPSTTSCAGLFLKLHGEHSVCMPATRAIRIDACHDVIIYIIIMMIYYHTFAMNMHVDIANCIYGLCIWLRSRALAVSPKMTIVSWQAIQMPLLSSSEQSPNQIAGSAAMHLWLCDCRTNSCGCGMT